MQEINKQITVFKQKKKEKAYNRISIRKLKYKEILHRNRRKIRTTGKKKNWMCLRK